MVYHDSTFRKADAAQARLFSMGDDVAREIADPKHIADVDHTGHLIVSAFQLIAQAQFAALLSGPEALEYSKEIVKHAEGAQTAQSQAPVDGSPAIAVVQVNRQIVAIIRTVLNKTSALKTTLALQQLTTKITEEESNCTTQ